MMGGLPLLLVRPDTGAGRMASARVLFWAEGLSARPLDGRECR